MHYIHQPEVVSHGLQLPVAVQEGPGCGAGHVALGQ